MDLILTLILSMLGIILAWVVGLLLKKRFGYKVALFWAIIVGRILVALAEWIMEVIKK